MNLSEQSVVIASRNGMISSIVFPLMIMALTLATVFYFMARQGRQVALRYRLSELSRQLAQAGAEEAFFWLTKETGNYLSGAHRWLLEDGNAPLEIPLTTTAAQAKLFSGGIQAEISAQARVIDRRISDSTGRKFRGTADAKDSLVSIAIQVDVKTIGNLSQKMVNTSLIQHHDAGMSSIVSSQEFGKRKGYCQAFPLDYALLVRDGIQELQQIKQELPDPQLSVSLEQDSLPSHLRGKVCFGSVDLNLTSFTIGAGKKLPDLLKAVNETNRSQFFNSVDESIPPQAISEKGFRPYGCYALWAAKAVPSERLGDIGVFDFKEGIINLRGIIYVQGSVALSPINGKAWQIKGQGVIVADSFHIQTGILRHPDSPESVCVFMARNGNIVVETSDPLETSLIAINDELSGAILPIRPMNLGGALVCDKLALKSWSNGHHRIRFDSRLYRANSLHQIWISNWIKFRRISEDKEEG